MGGSKIPADHDKYGDRGTFTMTIDAKGQTFKGEWVNAADASKKGLVQTETEQPTTPYPFLFLLA